MRGLGGCTKRMADQAMKSGKVVIQDATDFFVVDTVILVHNA